MFPLSKREKQHLKEIEEALKDGDVIKFKDDADYLEVQDMLELLIQRGFVEEVTFEEQRSFSMITKKGYKKVGDFQKFDSWVDDQEKKAKKKSRREWTIAIVCAILGAVVGLIPTFLQLLGIIKIN